ncbi:hypothetical protein LOTGIDRAFT_237034 [Lottia gigantea]|uniref:Uncharacterized protein n=1 Tax=Lottia gigantea TaxID=225164 RepID=V3ZEE9_LOTGI|nr:hypothetical protein LOTGIDRAFT_237034 [Lottia gigantea]ESO82442.1 hypothetical protein LOTGIDRAFT_237034 [Lottia gigantea]
MVTLNMRISGYISLWILLLKGSFSLELDEELKTLRYNYSMPLFERIRSKVSNTRMKLTMFQKEPTDQFCPCTYHNDSSVIQDLVSFGSHVTQCSKEMQGIASKMSTEQGGSETVHTVKQQIKYLKRRIALIKHFMEREARRIQMSLDRIAKSEKNPILHLVSHLNLQNDIQSNDPRGPRNKIYSYLVQQNRQRKPLLAQQISQVDVCSSFQKKFCTVRDLIVIDEESYLARIKRTKFLVYYHINGTMLGKFQTPSSIQGLARLSRGKDVIIGSPRRQKIFVLRLVPQISLLREINIGGKCPYGLTEVEDKIAIACAESIRFYDKSWYLLNEFPITNLTYNGKGFSWLTFNPVSRLLLFTNSETRRYIGINLDGKVVFQKESSWFPLSSPTSVVVNANGDQYVADMYKKRIVKYGLDGGFLGHLQNIIASSVNMVNNNTLLIGNQLSQVSLYRLL